ncbi:MAG: squalene synthase HpnC [Pseudomonadota bacterium]
MAVDHYENFPVASWLCPPRLRPVITAIYWFARTADDIADEGDAPAQQRLDELAAFRANLHAVAAGQPPSARWAPVFTPLAQAMADFKLPVPLLADLLSAFEQDVRKTRDGASYADRAELLDYCRRSANPVGRLLLHLYGITDATSLAESDHICTALQLANFWQDLSVDIPRGRHYLPDDACAAHGVSRSGLAALQTTPNTLKLIANQVGFTRAWMQKGLKLPKKVPGRAGWELRLVTQGGLAILDKIEAVGYRTLDVRPTVGRADVPRLLWRSLTM